MNVLSFSIIDQYLCALLRPKGKIGKMEKIGYSIAWALLLIFIAYPLSWFIAWWWILLLPFEDVFPFIKQATEFMEKLITWPRSVGRAMLNGETAFPSPM